MRIVLDTNVWLDWLVFGGNEIVALRAACLASFAQPVVDAPCMLELERVLAYPEFGLDADGIGQRMDEVRRLSATFPDSRAITAVAVPRCGDRDDQKFLELALAAGAAALLTRDKALLRLAGRARRRCGFDIVAPRDWTGGPGSQP